MKKICIYLFKYVVPAIAAGGTFWMALNSHKLAKLSLYEPKMEIENVDIHEELYNPVLDPKIWRDSTIDIASYEEKKQIVLTFTNSGKLAATAFIRIESKSSLRVFGIKFSDLAFPMDWNIQKLSFSEGKGIKEICNIDITRKVSPEEVLEMILVYSRRESTPRVALTKDIIGKYFKVSIWSPSTRFSSPDYFP